MAKTKLKTTRYDSAEYLKSEKDIAAYLDAALADGDPGVIRHALNVIARARGMTPTVALLTDGRGNIALDGTPGRAQAEADALRLARALRASQIPALVIDIANRPQPGLRLLADMLDAPYVPLPRADARKLSAVLTAAMAA